MVGYWKESLPVLEARSPELYSADTPRSSISASEEPWDRLIDRLSDTEERLRAWPCAVSTTDGDSGRETDSAAQADLKDVGIDEADREALEAARPNASISAALGVSVWLVRRCLVYGDGASMSERGLPSPRDGRMGESLSRTRDEEEGVTASCTP